MMFDVFDDFNNQALLDAVAACESSDDSCVTTSLESCRHVNSTITSSAADHSNFSCSRLDQTVIVHRLLHGNQYSGCDGRSQSIQQMQVVLTVDSDQNYHGSSLVDDVNNLDIDTLPDLYDYIVKPNKRHRAKPTADSGEGSSANDCLVSRMWSMESDTPTVNRYEMRQTASHANCAITSARSAGQRNSEMTRQFSGWQFGKPYGGVSKCLPRRKTPKYYKTKQTHTIVLSPQEQEHERRRQQRQRGLVTLYGSESFPNRFGADVALPTIWEDGTHATDEFELGSDQHWGTSGVDAAQYSRAPADCGQVGRVHGTVGGFRSLSPTRKLPTYDEAVFQKTNRRSELVDTARQTGTYQTAAPYRRRQGNKFPIVSLPNPMTYTMTSRCVGVGDISTVASRTGVQWSEPTSSYHRQMAEKTHTVTSDGQTTTNGELIPVDLNEQERVVRRKHEGRTEQQSCNIRSDIVIGFQGNPENGAQLRRCTGHSSSKRQSVPENTEVNRDEQPWLMAFKVKDKPTMTIHWRPTSPGPTAQSSSSDSVTVHSFTAVTARTCVPSTDRCCHPDVANHHGNGGSQSATTWSWSNMLDNFLGNLDTQQLISDIGC